jgi:hypothetical protein
MAIVQEIKKNSLPAYSTQGTAALMYPPMVELKLMPWNQTNEDFIRFKKCLIKNVSVNYAPAGLPSFFRNTRDPTMIQLELQFLETEIQTARDYGLQAGERPDGLEKLKDFADKNATSVFGRAYTEARDAGQSALRTTIDAISGVVEGGTPQ